MNRALPPKGKLASEISSGSTHGLSICRRVDVLSRVTQFVCPLPCNARGPGISRFVWMHYGNDQDRDGTRKDCGRNLRRKWVVFVDLTDYLDRVHDLAPNPRRPSLRNRRPDCFQPPRSPRGHPLRWVCRRKAVEPADGSLRRPLPDPLIRFLQFVDPLERGHIPAKRLHIPCQRCQLL